VWDACEMETGNEKNVLRVSNGIAIYRLLIELSPAPAKLSPTQTNTHTHMLLAHIRWAYMHCIPLWAMGIPYIHSVAVTHVFLAHSHAHETIVLVIKIH